MGYTLKLLIGLATALTVATAIDWTVTTPLDEYVQADDGHYRWEHLATYRYNSCSLHVVNMTSQKWQNEGFVDRPFWWHHMGIAVPDEANITYTDFAFMLIGAGSNDNDAPGEDDALNILLCEAAVDLGSVAGYISQVPNQPLYFENDPTYKRRSEDSIIAWTWRTFIDDLRPNPDVTVAARMPMTKAAKRGMDTINEVASLNHDYIEKVDRFAVTGASKRGWTTWSLAATDQRVVAIAPLVFSMLKFNETMPVHNQALGGGWSFAFAPYWRENLTQELLTEKAQEAFFHEDMWYYRERLTLPILQCVSTGDEFFLLQDSHQWWNDIPDPKWTYMLENAEHAMFPHWFRLYETITAWLGYQLQDRDDEIPVVTWKRGETTDGGYINFTVSGTPPEEITAFRAVTLVNDSRRDFRLAAGYPDTEFHPVLWDEEGVTLESTTVGENFNEWTATTTNVDDEWVGFLVQGMWRGLNGVRMYFTSETQVVPDTFPVDRCTDAESCYGVLV